MTGQLSEIAARILMETWYKSYNFNIKEIDQFMDGQVEALKSGESFSLHDGLTISVGSDNKFYLRGER